MSNPIPSEDLLAELVQRWPNLEPHIRKLKAAIRRGDEADATKLAKGLAIAVEAFSQVPNRRPKADSDPEDGND